MKISNTYIPAVLNAKFESIGTQSECNICSVNLPASPAGKWLVKRVAGGPQQKEKH
jgi:hypothetical protein